MSDPRVPALTTPPPAGDSQRGPVDHLGWLHLCCWVSQVFSIRPASTHPRAQQPHPRPSCDSRNLPRHCQTLPGGLKLPIWEPLPETTLLPVVGMWPDPGWGQGLAGTPSLGRYGRNPGGIPSTGKAAGWVRGQLRAELAASDGGRHTWVSAGAGGSPGGHGLGLRPLEAHQACVLTSAHSTRRVSQGAALVPMVHLCKATRHTLVISGGSPGGLVGEEAVSQGAGARPAVWDPALPQNALFVFQLGLQAWLLLSKLWPLFWPHPSRFFPNSKRLGSPSWENLVTY